MAKSTHQFVCQNCGAAFSKWSGKCLECGSWDSLVETVLEGTKKGSASVVRVQPEKLTSVDTAKLPRISTGLSEVDDVLGGGLVPGSLALISGDPGVGKSTLILQLAANIAQHESVLYVSGEESAMQIKLRADRLGLKSDRLEILSTTSLDQIVAQASSGQYKLIVVDSIQTMATEAVSSAAGTVSQITNSTNFLLKTAKQTHTSFIIIGHVTKEGNLAGPKILEHLVDVVLSLEGDTFGVMKVLKASKNRYGSTNEAGVFEMGEQGLQQVDNPSAVLLEERQQLPGSVVLATLEGSRPLLVEVQALVSPSVFGYPKRTAAGFDLNRLGLLAAVLTKRGGINLSSQDIYVNIVGGLRITEPAADLAIILAIASAYKNITLPDDMVVFGEVGLSGEIRSVAMADSRLREAKKLGFARAIVPRSVKSSGVSTPASIAEAIKLLQK